MAYRLEKKPCRYANNYFDWVPMPFGNGNCQMPGFECTYEGDTQIPDELTCNEDNTCPAYSPVDTVICPKHDEEYITGEECSTCMEEDEARFSIGR